MNFEGDRHNMQYYGNKALQSFYRQELDNQLAERSHMKQKQLRQKEEERQLFNERIAQQEELEKIKDLSYKNMVMNNQSMYADNLKERKQSRNGPKQKPISESMYQEGMRLINDDTERTKRLMQTKNMYKRDLLQQLKAKQLQKQEQKYKKMEERHQGERLMGEIRDYQQKQKCYHKEAKIRYKAELDKLKDEGKTFEGYRKQHDRMKQRTRQKTETTVNDQETHNVISNPMPYRIQNPYILKELRRNNNGNKGYFAGIAAMGLQN